MNSSQLLDLFTNPNTIGSLSTSDKMLASLYVIILGMSATFIVLSLLSIVTSKMSKMVARFYARKSLVQERMKEEEQPLSTTEDEDEIAAIIAVAVAAFNE